MSIKYFSIRLTKNALYFIQNFVRVRRFNILDNNTQNVVLRRRHLNNEAQSNAQVSTLKTVSSTVGSQARRVLIENAFSRISSNVTSELRRRITRRFFHGDSVPLFALIGLTISAGNGLVSKDDEQEILCMEIREAISKFPWKFDFNDPNEIFTDEKVGLQDLEIGGIIAKGCSAVVYKAKVKNESDNVFVETFGNKAVTHPLALKIMFNYDIQSSSIAILRAMYKETIPARVCLVNEKISFWETLFSKQKIHLPSHPNIVTVYNAFADLMPNLSGSMDIYPDALPFVHNPEGYGRNMTLFLLMKRYQSTLRQYLGNQQIELHNSVLLLGQLLEGIAHLNRHGIAHRDLKSDNILIDEIQVGENVFAPLLVITDFGCCLADTENGLRLHYRSDSIDKGGNMSLMAPEIITQQPGMFSVLDYSKSDLWAVGAIAYEIFGFNNPFLPNGLNDQEQLFNYSYEDNQLPNISNDVPSVIRRLIKNLLTKNPKDRLSPEIAANVCQLYLWAPSSWISSRKLPNSQEVLEWLMCLTTKVICEGRLFNKYSECDIDRNGSTTVRSANPEYALISSFLSRVRFSHLKDALKWIQAYN